jgi:hypothetical protein
VALSRLGRQLFDVGRHAHHLMQSFHALELIFFAFVSHFLGLFKIECQKSRIAWLMESIGEVLREDN